MVENSLGGSGYSAETPGQVQRVKIKSCDSGTSGGRRIWNTRGPLQVAESQIILGDLRILGVIRRWNVCLMT